MGQPLPPRARRRQGTLGEHIITLTPEGVRERTGVNDTIAYWLAVHGVFRSSCWERAPRAGAAGRR